MTLRRLNDWTKGQPGIVTYSCTACSKRFYFERNFCPGCGSSVIVPGQSEAHGTVLAVTLLHRAPTDELRAHAPYLIALVTLDDGITVMGHGELALTIGNRVHADFVVFGDQPTIPFFRFIGGNDD